MHFSRKRVRREGSKCIFFPIELVLHPKISELRILQFESPNYHCCCDHITIRIITLQHHTTSSPHENPFPNFELFSFKNIPNVFDNWQMKIHRARSSVWYSENIWTRSSGVEKGWCTFFIFERFLSNNSENLSNSVEGIFSKFWSLVSNQQQNTWNLVEVWRVSSRFRAFLSNHCKMRRISRRVTFSNSDPFWFLFHTGFLVRTHQTRSKRFRTFLSDQQVGGIFSNFEPFCQKKLPRYHILSSAYLSQSLSPFLSN